MDKFDKVLSFFNSQAGLVNSFWNLYALVALGFIGFVFTHKELFAEKRNKEFLAIVFIFFAASNAYAMYESQVILYAVGKEVSATAAEFSDKLLSVEFRDVLKSKKEAIEPWVVMVYHFILDIAVISMIYLFPKHGEK